MLNVACCDLTAWAPRLKAYPAHCVDCESIHLPATRLSFGASLVILPARNDIVSIRNHALNESGYVRSIR